MRSRNPFFQILLIVLAVVVLVGWFRKMFPSLTKPSAPASASEAIAAHAGPPDIYPDPARTPGVTNPAITQANIHETICNPRWRTKSVRPDRSYTDHLKARQIREYGYSDVHARDYEEDHFIPLELGGNPTDPRNLWPEPLETSIPDGGANAKNEVEKYLRAEVCSGALTLEQAQREISEDWYRVYKSSVPH